MEAEQLDSQWIEELLDTQPPQIDANSVFLGLIDVGRERSARANRASGQRGRAGCGSRRSGAPRRRAAIALTRTPYPWSSRSCDRRTRPGARARTTRRRPARWFQLSWPVPTGRRDTATTDGRSALPSSCPPSAPKISGCWSPRSATRHGSTCSPATTPPHSSAATKRTIWPPAWTSRP